MNRQLAFYAAALKFVQCEHDRVALSEGFEPGYDPYNSADVARPIDFGVSKAEFLADEAAASSQFLDDDSIRRVVRPKPAGHDAVRQARYGAIALEADRCERIVDAINLCAVGDIDETSDDGMGWGDWVRRAKAVL
jgi:hypothetical protein